MANKVYPYGTSSSSPPPSSSSYEKETFTIWMKSLVLNSSGYTIYDSNGKIVYRIDNYDTKSCNEVYLMDLRGNVLCTILQRKWLRFKVWDCHKSNTDCNIDQKPWFRVSKKARFFKRDSLSDYDVAMASQDEEAEGTSCFKMEGSVGKSDFKIIDNQGRVMAQVRRKESSSGVVLGEDVLSLAVEPLVDHIFVMVLVAIYGLIGHKM